MGEPVESRAQSIRASQPAPHQTLPRGAARTPALAFERVTRDQRLSDKVARRILEVIVDSPLRPGDALPSERDLCEQFGVSRTVIREALRSLAGKGILDMTQGRGLRVARVEPSTVSESMSLYLRSRPALDYRRLHEVRALLEVEVAGLAAQRATAADLEALSEVCDQMAQVLDLPAKLAEPDNAFHRLLARATHNELFLVLLDAISDQLMEIRVEAFEMVERQAHAALVAHRAIYEEVAHGAPERARTAMREHLDDVLLAWRQVATMMEADGGQVAHIAMTGTSAPK